MSKNKKNYEYVKITFRDGSFIYCLREKQLSPSVPVKVNQLVSGTIKAQYYFEVKGVNPTYVKMEVVPKSEVMEWQIDQINKHIEQLTANKMSLPLLSPFRLVQNVR